MRARDYDPQTRQFFRVDPALDLTGQPYAYAGNNPLSVTDPLGLFGFEALGSWFDQVTASAYHGLKSGPGVAVTSFVVGFGDSIRFGLAEAARESLAPGSPCQVIKDGFYSAGGLASSFVPIPGLGVAAAAFKVGAVAVAGAATVVIKAIPSAVTAAKGLPKALIGGTVMAAKTPGVSNAGGQAVGAATTAAGIAAKADRATAVIGRLPDTAVAKSWPGHEVLDISDWTIRKNDEWVQSVIDRKMPVYVGSNPTWGNIWDAAAGRSTVFGRELSQFTNAGYAWNAWTMLPPGGG